MVANAASMSPTVLAVKTINLCLYACAAASRSFDWASAVELLGFTSAAIVVSEETTSRMSSSRFANIMEVSPLTPVALPPGRLRLVTRPSFTGSVEQVNTIGIVAVAALTASAGGSPPDATITAT